MKDVILKCTYPGEFATFGTLTLGSIYIGKLWDSSDIMVNVIDDKGDEVAHKLSRFRIVMEATGVDTPIDPEPVPKSERQAAEEMLVKPALYVTTDGKRFDVKETAIGYQICLNAYKDRWK